MFMSQTAWVGVPNLPLNSPETKGVTLCASVSSYIGQMCVSLWCRLNELEFYRCVCQINFSVNIYWTETKCIRCSEERIPGRGVIQMGRTPPGDKSERCSNSGAQAMPRQEGEHVWGKEILKMWRLQGGAQPPSTDSRLSRNTHCLSMKGLGFTW